MVLGNVSAVHAKSAVHATAWEVLVAFSPALLRVVAEYALQSNLHGHCNAIRPCLCVFCALGGGYRRGW